MKTTTSLKVPPQFFDSHHHFLDTSKNDFQTFLGSLVPNETYLPTDYHRDVVAPLQVAGIQLVGSTHMECLPDDGVKEAAWVDGLSQTKESKIQAIVASADLASPTVAEDLARLRTISPQRLKGIRWILDCVGKFDGKSATHVATTRHDGIDYLRGSEGGYNGTTVPAFKAGFALLEEHGLSFDLQCAPVQLEAAAELFAQYPKIPCVINHLGKPRTLLGPDTPENTNTVPNQDELQAWRQGMKAMAALPHVYVKLSLLGYAIPGWTKTEDRIQLAKELVLETVKLFGPQRCMVATNYWKSDALSDADGLSDVGPTPVELLTLLNEWLSDDYSEADRQAIFCDTARKFYRV